MLGLRVLWASLFGRRKRRMTPLASTVKRKSRVSFPPGSPLAQGSYHRGMILLRDAHGQYHRHTVIYRSERD